MPYRIKSPFTHQRIGRRGACLLIFGLIPAMVGLAQFVQPRDAHGHARTIPVLEKLPLPVMFWGAAWVALGVVTMLCAFIGHRAHELGFRLAYSLPFFWGAAYLASWALGELITGWVASVIYLGYCLLVVVIAGWQEPITTPLELLPDGQEDKGPEHV